MSGRKPLHDLDLLRRPQQGRGPPIILVSFFGGFLLLGARAGDILGRRSVFVFGLFVLAVASLLISAHRSPRPRNEQDTTHDDHPGRRGAGNGAR